MRALYRRPHCGAAGLSAVPRRHHAVVVGGSLAGMLAARVLSDHFDRVTLLERDRFPETPAARKGLPQGRHGHVLLERGRAALERFNAAPPTWSRADGESAGIEPAALTAVNFTDF